MRAVGIVDRRLGACAVFVFVMADLFVAVACLPGVPGIPMGRIAAGDGFLAIFFAPLRILPRWLRKHLKKNEIPYRAEPHEKLDPATVLAHPLTPAQWLPKPATSQFPEKGRALRATWSPNGGEGEEGSRVILWLLRWLLFRLMFESGVVKLASGDETWRHLTALNYHYQTQPLPTWIGWYAQQLPEGFQKICVLAMFGIELAAPFLIFAPRRLRLMGCGLLVFLQVIIMMTGNYCFFNLLTLALCLLLLDDAALRKLISKRWRKRSPESSPSVEVVASDSGTLQEIIVPATPSIPERHGRRWSNWVTVPLALLILFITVQQVWDTLHGARGRLAWPESMSEWIQPFDSVNSYGLFAVMTTTRPEIIIEGSNDGTNWLAYEFKYKPGDLKRRPAFVAPHQPRLDWQMWFAALSDVRQNRWLVNFCVRLLQGSPEVLKLMGKNPFPDRPPRYIRAQLYDYRFTDFEQHRPAGAWWRRDSEGEYMPAISLQGGK
jgi:hypothetical protein